MEKITFDGGDGGRKEERFTGTGCEADRHEQRARSGSRGWGLFGHVFYKHVWDIGAFAHAHTLRVVQTDGDAWICFGCRERKRESVAVF